MHITIPFFQSLWISPECHDLEELGQPQRRGNFFYSFRSPENMDDPLKAEMCEFPGWWPGSILAVHTRDVLCCGWCGESGPSAPVVGQNLLDFMYPSSLLQWQLSKVTNGVQWVVSGLSGLLLVFYMEWDVTQLNLKYYYFWGSGSITVNKCFHRLCYHTGESSSRIQHHCLPVALSHFRGQLKHL